MIAVTITVSGSSSGCCGICSVCSATTGNTVVIIIITTSGTVRLTLTFTTPPPVIWHMYNVY